MTRLRSLVLARRWLALAIVAAGLAVRVVVPAGMMPQVGPGGPTLILCTGHGAVSMPGEHRPDPAKADAPCAFTGLLAAALDVPLQPVLPVRPLPLEIVLAAALAGVTVRTGRLRPPLRGPPGAFPT